MAERLHGVWLHERFVGMLRQRGDHVTFRIHPSYADDPHRPVLGQVFEQDLRAVHSSSLRLPPWFSNLLPEGVQRGWVAAQRDVSPHREMELLAQVGHDLPGAVRVMTLPGEAFPAASDDAPHRSVPPPEQPSAPEDVRGRFSLAGVQLKLSMVVAGDRLVVPLGGTPGDWIVKFPDVNHPRLPVIEYATMQLAARSGIEVPELKLVNRHQLPDTPESLWVGTEELAYAIRRFDRAPDGSAIHIEDLAQVQNKWPDQKYEGRYETMAARVHRGHDDASVVELVRRIAFNVLIDNSDAHAKNFSLLYVDPRRPRLSPAYDVVSVAPYPGYGGEMALQLSRKKRADAITLDDIGGLGRRLGIPKDLLVDVARDTIIAAKGAWPDVAAEVLADDPEAHSSISAVMQSRAASLGLS